MNARPGLYREAGQPPGGMKSAATGTADQRVFAERVRMLYSGIGLVAGVTLVNGLILAVLQRNIVGWPVAAGWFAFLAASIAWRATVVAMFRRVDPPPADMPRWARRYVVGAGFSGVAWGAAGIFLLPEESLTHQVFTAFVLGGMSAGAMSTLSRVHAAYVAYVVPALAPMSVHFALHGGEFGYALAAMATFMLSYLVYVGGIQSTVLDRSLRLAVENDELIRDLTEQTGKADCLNASLRREIDERRRIEADLREREASLENAQRIAGLGSWEWDMVTDTLRGSAEARRIFSVDSRTTSITYEQFLEMVHPDDREGLQQAVSDAIDGGKPYSFEHRVILADGSERFVHERGEVVRDEAGRPLAMRGTSHDVTEQHRIRRELESAKAQAEAANRAKSRFLANMSHEFRTPLNAIIGYSEILREDAQEAGLDSCLPDIDRINRAGRHLLTLINEVLDFSKIEAGKAGLFLETFDVRALAGDVISTVEPIMRENGNRLGLDCPADIGSMCADATKVRQILFNLLSNAAKFTENGDIGVTVRRLEEGDGPDPGGWLILTVQDTGIGMERDRVEAAFSAFDQLDASTTRKYGGTGLGLAITRHYCELMGGAISVESAPGEGSRFTVRLPLNVVAPDGHHG